MFYVFIKNYIFVRVHYGFTIVCNSLFRVIRIDRKPEWIITATNHGKKSLISQHLFRLQRKLYHQHLNDNLNSKLMCSNSINIKFLTLCLSEGLTVGYWFLDAVDNRFSSSRLRKWHRPLWGSIFTDSLIFADIFVEMEDSQQDPEITTCKVFQISQAYSFTHLYTCLRCVSRFKYW